MQRELALPRADAPLDGLREYAFRHQVLHQVTYDTVLRRHKQEGHAKVAQWLAALDSAVQRQCPHGSRDHGLHLMSDNEVSAHRRRVHEGCGDVGHYASIYQLQQSEGERGYGTPNANAEGRTTLAP